MFPGRKSENLFHPINKSRDSAVKVPAGTIEKVISCVYTKMLRTVLGVADVERGVARSENLSNSSGSRLDENLGFSTGNGWLMRNLFVLRS